jgi:hypothetical protein
MARNSCIPSVRSKESMIPQIINLPSSAMKDNNGNIQPEMDLSMVKMPSYKSETKPSGKSYD